MRRLSFLLSWSIVIWCAVDSRGARQQQLRRMLADDITNHGTFSVSVGNSAGDKITSDPITLFVADFGRNISSKNPLSLFTISGSGRVDVLYSQEIGLLYVLASVANSSEPGIMEFEIPEGVTTDDQGGSNKGASDISSYAPASDYPVFGYVIGWTMFGAAVLSLGGSSITSKETIAVGFINFIGFVQIIYMVGNLPITSMPWNYRQAAQALSWVALNPSIGPISTDYSLSSQPDIYTLLSDTSLRFPRTPIRIQGDFEGDEIPDVPQDDSKLVVTLPFSGDGSSNETSIGAEETNVTMLIIEEISIGDDSIDGESPANPFESVPETNGEQSIPVPDQVSGPSVGEDGSRVPPNESSVPEDKINNFVEDESQESPSTSESSPGTDEEKQSPQELPPAPEGDTPSEPSITDQNISPSILKSPPPPPPPPLPTYETPILPPDTQKVSPPPAVKLESPPPPYEKPVPSPEPKVPSPPPPYEKPVPSPQKIIPSPPYQNPKPSPQVLKPSPPPPFRKPQPSPPAKLPTLPPEIIKLPVINNPTLNLDNLDSLKQRRKLLIVDPVEALGSSGFSYTVVTATPETISQDNDGVSEDLSEEVIGSSILSRIRAIQDAGNVPDANQRRLDVLWNVLFWSAIALLATFFIHGLVLLFLRLRKIQTVPKMLHIPRIELVIFMIILPMVCAAGCACLQSTSPGVLAAGACLGVVLPFGYLMGVSVFIMFSVVRPTLQKRRALYIVNESNGGDTILQPNSDGSSGNTPSPDSGGLTTALNLDYNEDKIDSLPQNESRRSCGTVNAASHISAWVYKQVLSPLFGFSSSRRATIGNEDVDTFQPTWEGSTSKDIILLKRFGCFFEDAHGPRVIKVSNNQNDKIPQDNAGHDQHADAIFYMPAKSSMETTEIFQTFGVLFALTKLMLFAAIINAAGGVNNIGQVAVLVVFSLLHIFYLRFFVPYRLRIELAAEIVASVCDLAVFVCGIILISKTIWSTTEGTNMGIAMLVLQAVGFLVFITVRVILALRTIFLTISQKSTM